MMMHRTFWWGFLAAYALAYFLPPRALLSRGKKS